MQFSAYQIESLLEDFQKKIFPIEKKQRDKVSISEEILDESRQLVRSKENPFIGEITSKNISDLVEDKTTYDPIIDYVQQSRAGRFVKPNFIPENLPPTFPLVKNISINEKRDNSSSESKKKYEFNNKKLDPNKNEKNKLKNKSEFKEDSFEKTFCKIQKKSNESENKASRRYNKNDSGLIFMDNEDEEGSISISLRSDGGIDNESDVVFGEGPITKNSITKFISNYPDSAIKFLFKKNLDGRPLPVEYEEIYQKWLNRGLTREKLKKLLFKLMQWEEFPEIPVLEILKQIRENLFDIKKSEDEYK